MARTLRLTLQYDGTDFVGWQRQASGAAIQALVEDAIGRIEGRRVTVTGAGRTDAGVHALGQVASVVLEHPIAGRDLRRALNAALPDAIRVVEAVEAAAGFHARFDAVSKTYRYVIVNAAVVSPFDVRYAWHVRGPLDCDAMRRALPAAIGRHDFSAFQSTGSDVKTSVRRVVEATLEAEPIAAAGDLAGTRLTLTVTADGFLRHMVRALAGTLVEVGAGRRGPGEIARVLASRDRAQAGPTAPARGLWLVRVTYREADPAEGRGGG